MRDLELVRRARDALYEGNFSEALRSLDAFTQQNEYEMSEKAVLDNAETIRRQRYDKLVETAVEKVFEDWKEGTFADSNDLHQALEAQAEVSQYDLCFDVLYFSDNNGGADDDIGVESLDWKGGMPWGQLAFYAMREDIRDGLKEKEVDVWNTPPKESVEMCAGCGEWKPTKTWKKDHCSDCEDLDAGSSSGPGPEPM